MEKPRPQLDEPGFMHRPVHRAGLLLMIAAITAAPALLFFDPAPAWPGERHVPREPISSYCLFSDDVAYVGCSRTFDRTIANLFVPHNTHIVPAWRLVTWALAAWAGNLERLPDVLALASYSILVAVMLIIGRFVERETGRTELGLASAILVGTTSLMLTPATWYSAGQTLWAGFGVLATLWYAQSYRRAGRASALFLSMIAAMLAGWFWTAGHLAGPVAAVYLIADGRRRCRTAAAAPLAASVIAAGASLALGSSRMAAAVSFHGHSIREAFTPVQGFLHMLQAIPENLAFGNLGLAVETTQLQGSILTIGLIALWLYSPRLRRRGSGPADSPQVPSGPVKAMRPLVSPLECAGFTLMIGSYLLEWSFRGYMEYRFLRTINLRFIVPWYNVIPQIGAVLWFAGFWAEYRPVMSPNPSRPNRVPLTRLGCVRLCVLIVAMIVLHRPRVDFLVRESAPALLRSERRFWPILSLQMMRANALLSTRAEWHRANLRRLDRAEAIANRLGLGRDTIRANFGHPQLPGTVGLLRPDLQDLYDAVALLAIPEHGRATIPVGARMELAQLFAEEKEPRPQWIGPDEIWPPADDATSRK